MNKKCKFICSMVVATSISVGFSMPVFASTITNEQVMTVEKSVEELKAELIYYYKTGQSTDILRTFESIKSVSEKEYNRLKQVIDFWDYTENSMVESIGVAPDGLPDTNKHAFVVLGYALNSDGSMQDELKGRCQVAYESAMKYPNAYVVLAGGGTAADNKEVTEAGQMRDYMVNELNFDESRLIIEDKSMTTVQNAQNTFNILYNQYDISTISMISSQYHLKRASLLYYTQSLIAAEALGKTPIELVGNAGWLREDKTYEPLDLKALTLSQLLGVQLPETLEASKLQSLEVEGKTTYKKGEELELSVTAKYDIDDYTRDITEIATIEGYDANVVGEQTITVTYTENDVTKTAEFKVTVNDITTDDDTSDKDNSDDNNNSDKDDSTSNGGTSNGGTSNGGTSNGGTSNGSNSNTGSSNKGNSNITKLPNTGDGAGVIASLITGVSLMLGGVRFNKKK